jgi:SWI/SNF-related matrix-associated actin-dependent regulator 1 of chromatin subfamily A
MTSPYHSFLTREKHTSILPINWDKLPDNVVKALLPHQKQALRAAIEENDGRFLVAAGMGCGKTLIGLVFAYLYTGSVLFITSKTILQCWIDEDEKWGLNDKEKMIEVTGKTKLTDRMCITFDIAKKNKCVLERKWDIIVVDECHRIKGESQRSKNLIPMLENCGALLLLSGTPEESRTIELYNPLHCLFPRVFDNRKTFLQWFSEGYEDQFGNWIENKWRRSPNISELNMILKSVMYRITKAQALPNLPPKRRYKVIIEGDEDDQSALDNAEQQRVSFRNLKECERTKRIRQVHSNKTNILGGEIKAKASLAWTRDLIEKHPNEKIIFFAKHLNVIEIMKEGLKDYEHVVITGSTRPKLRKQHIKSIADPLSTVRIAFLTIDSCGTGITLCPGANIAVMLEMDYTPSIMEQAEDRLHRIGCITTVLIFWLFLKKSLDASVLSTLQNKHDLNKEVLDGISHSKIEFIDL